VPEIPDDIRDLAASYDSRWPLLPALADRPVRVDMWPTRVARFEADGEQTSVPDPLGVIDMCKLATALDGAGVPVETSPHEARAWFHNELKAKVAMPGPIGDQRVRWKFNGGNEHITLVVEYILASGYRHLHAWDDFAWGRHQGRPVFWLEGNWSHDCNRADEVVRDGVEDHGFELDAEGNVTGECTHSITLGWAVLRRRNRATGDVRYEVAIHPGEDRAGR
jgi:hypothetical protein